MKRILVRKHKWDRRRKYLTNLTIQQIGLLEKDNMLNMLSVPSLPTPITSITPKIFYLHTDEITIIVMLLIMFNQLTVLYGCALSTCRAAR